MSRSTLQLRNAGFPVEATVTVEQGGQLRKKKAFYVRIGSGTREIADLAEAQRYIATRWGASAGAP